MAEPNTDLFSGSGATGVQPSDAASSIAQLELVFHRAREAAFNDDIDYTPDRFCNNPRSPLSKYCNPGESNNGYNTIFEYTPEVRDQQTRTLLLTKVKRCTFIKEWLERGSEVSYRSNPIRQEIIDATSLTRAEYIKVVATRYDLEPELVAGIILVEQRDQSEAEDIADYISLMSGRHGTSIGLGQVTASSAINYGLLDDVIIISAHRLKKMAIYLLQDEAFNINATAKYLRLLANAAVEVQNNKTNSLLEKDSACRKRHQPADGKYENSTLLNLSIMGNHSDRWSNEPDSNLPAIKPDRVLNFSDGQWSELEVSQAEWDANRSHYYLRVLGSQYTSCPFTPSFLSTGIPQFYKKLDPLELAQYPDLSTSDWKYDPPKRINGWFLFLPIAYEDCRRSGLFS